MAVDKKISRVGLIGISGYGRIYLQMALEHQRRGELRLVAAVVINPEEEAAAVAELRRLECEIFPTYEAMLKQHQGALELCLIPTGIAWHTRMTLAALAAGANVLVEKPLACSVPEVLAIKAGAARAGRFVAVGFQDFYEPATAWLKRELTTGAIGTVKSVRFLGMWPRPRAYFTRNNWAGRLVVEGVPVLDSPLSNAFAHFVNLSLYFACPRFEHAADGRVRSAELLRAHEIESFDTAVVRLQTEDRVDLWLGATHACRKNRDPEITITGSAGSAHWRHERDVRLTVAGGKTRSHRVADANGARRAMMTTIIRRLDDPSVSICGPDLAGHHTAVIEAVSAAAKIAGVPGRLVRWVPPETPEKAVPVVEGLEASLARAYETGETLLEAGFDVGAPLGHAAGAA